MKSSIPKYLELYKSGELSERLNILEKKLRRCDICPRKCAVNRFKTESGYCLTGSELLVSSICDHHGEERVLSGRYGSGTVFFGSCNLRCIFCQNYQISQEKNNFPFYKFSTRELATGLVHLQNQLKVHNINFVSPTQFVPQIVRALYEAIPMGLNIPLVYNSNGYDSLETLQLLDGIIDIYLPDFKYGDEVNATKYSSAPHYPETAKKAIQEMYRQVGLLKLDNQGVARRGLLIRHLILPNEQAGSEQILRWIATNLSPDVAVSLMTQYYPAHRASYYPLISRQIKFAEYEQALNVLTALRMDSSFSQKMSRAAF